MWKLFLVDGLLKEPLARFSGLATARRAAQFAAIEA